MPQSELLKNLNKICTESFFDKIKQLCKLYNIKNYFIIYYDPFLDEKKSPLYFNEHSGELKFFKND
jgi:hypothetical protein